MDPTLSILLTISVASFIMLIVMTRRMGEMKRTHERELRRQSDEIRDAMLFSITEASKLADEMTATMTTTREALAEDSRVALAIETARLKAEAIAARLKAISALDLPSE